MINEAIVEQAALDWLKGLGYESLSGLTIAPAAERPDYKQASLFHQLQAKLLSGGMRRPPQRFGTTGVVATKN